ncbi:adenylosuccinate lyase [Aciduliprofundum boonei T469]|nr:adenylosuccinate lyase [Aciduliprofundum boonei T469]
MAVCPLDYRYGRDEVKKIFSEESKLRYMLLVEYTLMKAHAHFGNIPEYCAKAAKEAMDKVELERVKKIEKEIKHDVMAMVKAYAEKCGECGKYVHLGATSNDIIDTATALQLKDLFRYIERDFELLENALAELAAKYKNTVMLGRTHGQAAVPITFGLKTAVFLAEILRHHERFEELKKRVLVGKMIGAVGTGAALGDGALEIQEFVMKELGIGYEEASTQLVGRDRYVELVSFFSSLATSLEKFATEIRNLQRSEIGEVMEKFDVEKQVGSSTMAQKRNPITAENICGLARIIRGFLTPMHESAILWHERDLTNSSAERFIIPHTSILIDDIMVKAANLFNNLEINEERMLENIRSNEEVMAEAIIIFLVKNGWSRQDAHEKLRQVSMQPGKFRENLMKDNELRPILEGKIEELLNPKNYIGSAEKIVDNILERKNKMRENNKGL